ncbi:uncharacterized protein LOC131655500 [Vicia villosa]|uniref:uncharacterized protein LOC131655500 n=1 Tax=Vicia villosa TaxID=3911 RepID=UPI00273B81AA|nr:uncharacterized protein LOC131655500 [Vicia villosa]
MVLEGRGSGLNLDDNLLLALNGLWKSKTPSKVLIFGWRLLLNRIPTKVNLALRKILVDPLLVCCPLCGLEEEDVEHLFVRCSVTSLWWTKFCDWLDIDGALFRVAFRVGFLLGVWLCRNEIVFREVLLDSFDTMGLIKFLSWELFLSSFQVRDTALWVNWCVHPVLCF